MMEKYRNITQARVPMDTSSSANPDTGIEPSARTVERGPPGGPKPSQTADEYVKSGRQMVLDVLGKLYSTAEDCGSSDHEHFACENPGKDAIKNALNVIRDCMTEKSGAAADTSMDDAFASGQNVDATVDDGGDVSDEEDDVFEDNLYDVPLCMSVKLGIEMNLDNSALLGRELMKADQPEVRLMLWYVKP